MRERGKEGTFLKADGGVFNLLWMVTFVQQSAMTASLNSAASTSSRKHRINRRASGRNNEYQEMKDPKDFGKR